MQIFTLLTKFFCITAILVVSLTAYGQKNRPSPAKITEGIIDGAQVTINYSSPAVKGRTIWGELVPYNTVWRAGANEATTVSTDQPLKIFDEILPAGTYSFFVKPLDEQKWVVIFNKDIEQWGAYKYDENNDIIRGEVNVEPLNDSIEQLSYQLDSVNNNISLIWEKKSIYIPVTNIGKDKQ
ncbi:MAG: hypothetical protein CMO01_03705 [Thalassobius sp.]|nr:hypothetical protein [Thalassovita sp.]